MIALKSFQNKFYGNIVKGEVIPERVLKGMDVTALKEAGFIVDEKDINDGIKVTDKVSFSSVKVNKKKVVK